MKRGRRARQAGVWNDGGPETSKYLSTPHTPAYLGLSVYDTFPAKASGGGMYQGREQISAYNVGGTNALIAAATMPTTAVGAAAAAKSSTASKSTASGAAASTTSATTVAQQRNIRRAMQRVMREIK